MNFLNSAILAGLAAALVPLLIHLLNRRRLRTVDFSSVMFLRDLRKTRMRRLQLRRWLLLAVRTLLIAVAVLAFARPALQGGGLFSALGSRARTTAVLAIDRSASMALETHNGTAHDRAKQRIAEMSDLWGEGDDAIALPFTDTPSSVSQASANIAAVTERLRATTVGSGGTDAGAVLRTALDAVRTSENLNREIYLFGDFYRHGFVQTTVGPPEPGDDNVTIYMVDVAEKGGFDLNVSSVTLENQLIEPGSPFGVRASITNHTDATVDRLLVSLFIDGHRVAQRETHVSAAATATVAFTASVPTAGVHDGFVEISADDNPLNNRRHFALSVPDEISVLLASDYPSGRLATGLVLSPNPGSGQRLQIDPINTDDIVRHNLFDYDCVLITDWRSPSRATVDHLLRFVRSGGGVFAVPSFDADTTAWNELIATPYFGRRLGPRPIAPQTDRYFVWEDYDWNHPIWSVYAGVKRERIPEIRWHSIFRTEGSEESRTLVRFSGGRPALSEVAVDAGKLIVMWSPMNASYTNLPLRSVFVPFMHRLAEYCATDLSERRSDYRVGEPVVRELSHALPPDVLLEVVGPDGSRLRPGIDRSSARTRITIDGLKTTGVYRVVVPVQGNRVLDAFSVNTDPLETAPERIGKAELTRRLDGHKLVFVDPDQALIAAVNQTRYGTEIRPAFLWAVVVLFFLEMWLARTRRRDIPIATSSVPSGATPRTGVLSHD